MSSGYKPPDKTYEKPYVSVAARGDGKPMEVGGLTVRIMAHAFDRLQTFITECPHEVGGYARVLDKGDHLLITDIEIAHQEAGAAHTTIEGEDEARFMEEVILARDDEPKNWRGWWHSHVRMAAYFSLHEDVPTINKRKEQLPSLPWQVSIVGNKHGEFRARFDLYEPKRLTIDNLSLEIVFGHGEALGAQIREEIKTHIRPAKYPLAGTAKGGVRVKVKDKKGERGLLDRIIDWGSGRQVEGEMELEEGARDVSADADIVVPTFEQYQKMSNAEQSKVIAVWQELLKRIMVSNALMAKAVADEMGEPGREYLLGPFVYGPAVAFVSDGSLVWRAIEAATRLAVRKQQEQAPTSSDTTEETPRESASLEVPPTEKKSVERPLWELTMAEYKELATYAERDTVIEAWVGRYEEILCTLGVSESDVRPYFRDGEWDELLLVRDKWAKPAPRSMFKDDPVIARSALTIAQKLLNRRELKSEHDELMRDMEAKKTLGAKDKLLDEWCEEIREINKTLGLEPAAFFEGILIADQKDHGGAMKQLLNGNKPGSAIKGVGFPGAAWCLVYMSKLWTEHEDRTVAETPQTEEVEKPATVADATSAPTAEASGATEVVPEGGAHGSG